MVRNIIWALTEYAPNSTAETLVTTGERYTLGNCHRFLQKRGEFQQPIPLSAISIARPGNGTTWRFSLAIKIHRGEQTKSPSVSLD